MRGIWIVLWLGAIYLHAQEAEVEFPSEFTTKEGETYFDCKLKRAEKDSLIIEHKAGLAKISLFDVSPELQKKYDFDPVGAMKRYRQEQQIQRDLKWKRFLEGQKHAAAVENEKNYEKFLEKVKVSWLPVEAKIYKRNSSGAFVRAKRIKFVPTKTKSTLGFEIDGPPRKTLVPMEPSVIFIEATKFTGPDWSGYLEPFAHGTVDSSDFGADIPSYRGVARTEIK